MSTHNSLPAETPSGRKLDRPVVEDRLLRVLDCEIEEAHRRRAWPGWTPWMLLTATAALVWAGIGHMRDAHEPTVVTVAALATLLVVEVVEGVRALLRLREHDVPDSRVLVSGDLLRLERPALLIQVLYVGLIWWAMLSLAPGVPYPARVAILAWAAQLGLWALVAFGYSFWPVPVPEGVTSFSIWRLFGLGIPVLLAASALIGCGACLRHASLDGLQAGLLFGAAAGLFLKVANESQESPLFDTLVELRRDILLQRIEPTEAAERVRVVLAGMHLEDYVQHDARQMLRSMEDMRPALERFRPVLAAMRQQAALLSDGQVDRYQLQNMLNEWSEAGDVADYRYKRVARWQRRYELRLSMAAAISKLWHLPYEGQALTAEIKAKADPIMMELKQLLDEYHVVLERLEGTMRTAGMIK